MLKRNTILSNLSHSFLSSLLPKQLSYDKILFFDIETTGLNRRYTAVYLIGAVFWENDNWTLTQWFAEAPEQEEEILTAFKQCAQNRTCFIHYNGNRFDVPYLEEKYAYYHLDTPFKGKEQIDLYQRFLPLKKLFKLENMRQKDLESILSHARKDIFSGKELIKKHKEFLQNPAPELLEVLLLHNHDDLMGMLSILSLDAYFQLKRGNYFIYKNSLVSTVSYEGTEHQELLISLNLSLPLPAPFSYSMDGYYLTGKEGQAHIKSPVQDGMLKLYFQDYNNYYYLPLEDTAIHKSIGSFVDKEHRIPATPELCYQKIPCTDEFLSDDDSLLCYVRSLISYLL